MRKLHKKRGKTPQKNIIIGSKPMYPLPPRQYSIGTQNNNQRLVGLVEGWNAQDIPLGPCDTGF